MPQTRPQTRIAASLAAVFVCGLVSLLPSAASAQSTSEFLISASGVGPATLGTTADELAADLGPDYVVGDEVRITVDFDGRVVSRDDEVQFRAAMANSDDLFTLFIVSNPAYATAEGVGPMTTIAEAEAIYGDAMLSWNPDNEGREFVTFADGPEGRIDFRTPGIGGNNVGIYEDGEFETTEYEPDATIAAVWVSCIPGTDCPADLAATGTGTDDGADDGADGGADAGADDGADEPLPNTGADETLMIAIVSTLFVVGGAFVLLERRYSVPAWLR